MIIRFLQLTSAMTIVALIAACVSQPTLPQQGLDAWVGVLVDELDAHTFFKKVPMFRTKTNNGTEIRNYAYGYDFGECFAKAGGRAFGDFVTENAFTKCSSSTIVCNNIFYIKEQKVLEYAPTGRCDMDERVQPQPRELKLKNQ